MASVAAAPRGVIAAAAVDGGAAMSYGDLVCGCG